MSHPESLGVVETNPLEHCNAGKATASPDPPTSPATDPQGQESSESVIAISIWSSRAANTIQPILIILRGSQNIALENSTFDTDPSANTSITSPTQHTKGWIFKEKKWKRALLIFGALVTLTGLILQFRANRQSAEGNELTRHGNEVNEKAYKLQLWDDCRDRQVSRYTASSLEVCDYLSVSMTYCFKDLQLSELCHLNQSDLASRDTTSNHISWDENDVRLRPSRTLPKRKTRSLAFLIIWERLRVVFKCLVCYVLDASFIAYGKQITGKANTAHAAREENPQRQRRRFWRLLSDMFRPCPYMTFFITYLALERITWFFADQVCAVALGILFVLPFVVEDRIQHSRRDYLAEQDTEALGHHPKHPKEDAEVTGEAWSEALQNLARGWRRRN